MSIASKRRKTSITTGLSHLAMLFLLFVATPTRSAIVRLDDQLLALATDVTQGLRGKAVQKLAVVGFTFIDGRKSAETKYITDQFTVQVAGQAAGEFRLIERGDLSAIRAQSAEQTRLADDALLDRAKMTSRNIEVGDCFQTRSLSFSVIEQYESMEVNREKS